MQGHFNFFKLFAIRILESAINRILKHDEQTEKHLAPLAGKIIAIEMTSVSETVYLSPTTRDIRILENYCGPVDATLQGSLSSLGFMGLSTTPLRSLFKGEVNIDGDINVVRNLQILFTGLSGNTEKTLGAFTNPFIAKKISTLMQEGQSWSSQRIDHFRYDLEEFLQEETRNLPAKQEAELLFEQIDDCRSDIDRMNARIERLFSTLATLPALQDSHSGHQP